MKRRFIGGVGIALLAASLSVPAYAGSGHAKTFVSVARKNPFHGRVVPSKKVPACRIRHIRVLVQSPSANNVVARTTSNSKGRYHVAYSPHKNSYTVVANRKELKNGFVCRRGESHPINFNQ